MKKHLSIGLSAFALAALLSGCAGTSGTATSPTTAAANAARQRCFDVGSGVDVRTGRGHRGPQGRGFHRRARSWWTARA